MTRETKIGLLVGLAFIIVIGILLSDHINAAGDPLKADTTQAFNSLENSTRTLNAQRTGETAVILAPQPVVPQNRVNTESETEPRQNSGMVINITPGGNPSNIQIPQRPATVQGPTISQESVTQNGPQPPVTISEGNSAAANNAQANPAMPGTYVSQAERLAMEARKHDEDLVQTNGAPVGFSPAPLKPRIEPVAHPEGRQITAEENDTVSKFASKYMGANSKANREAIIRANPSVGPDGSKVFSGKTYLIPAPAAGGAQPQPTSSAPPVVVRATQPPATPAAVPTPAPAAPATAMYTVKENDTLWKIASEQLGSGTRYAEIQELNRDVLKGNSQVRPNMRLRMPAKAVATSN